MDKSKTYIKMCAKAKEIQSLRIYGKSFSTGDWWISRRWEDAVPTALQAYRGDDDIWLPRQDQLQEMINLDCLMDEETFRNKLIFLLLEFADFVKTNKQLFQWSYNTNVSLEQLWLAFVMKQQFKKRWDTATEEWVADGNKT